MLTQITSDCGGNNKALRFFTTMNVLDVGWTGANDRSMNSLCVCARVCVCVCACMCVYAHAHLQLMVAFDTFAGIYETFSGSKKFYFGKQPELIEGTDTVSLTIYFAWLF